MVSTMIYQAFMVSDVRFDLLLWNALLDEIELNLILPMIATSSGQKKRNGHLSWKRTCFVTDAIELFKHVQFLLAYDEHPYLFTAAIILHPQFVKLVL